MSTKDTKSGTEIEERISKGRKWNKVVPESQSNHGWMLLDCGSSSSHGIVVVDVDDWWVLSLDVASQNDNRGIMAMTMPFGMPAVCSAMERRRSSPLSPPL